MTLFVGVVWVRAGDSAQRDYSTDRLLGSKYWGGLRSVCKQRSGRESSAETSGKNRTQVGILNIKMA